MVTDIKEEKTAQDSGSNSILGKLSLPSNLFKTYLAYATGLGVVGGMGAGLLSAYVKSKNSDLSSINRQKRYLDRKMEEMENENWLNDLMDTRRKLETSKLPEDERDRLEKKYLELINK